MVEPARRAKPSAEATRTGGSFAWYVAEFGLGDELDAWTPTSRRLVLVPVGRLDARAVRPLEQAWRIPAAERRAVHVVRDPVAAEALADGWVARGLSVPLWFVECAGGVASTIARVVRFELAGGFEEVVVLVGRALLPRSRLVWHRRTADAIGRHVVGIPAVQVGVLNVAA